MKKSLVPLAAVAVAAPVCWGMLNTINCPDCGNTVSVRAFMCPKCGCARDAIQQHVRAVDELSKLPVAQQRKLSNEALFGQMGRIKWLNDERIVRNVLTNEVAATASYTPQKKKVAAAASETVRQMLAMGFTMHQIFIMRHDLIADILGQTAHGH